MSRAPRLLTLAEARAHVLDAARARTMTPERVPLRDAVGRALREDVIAPHDLPAFRNSAMDGFAVRSADLARASADAPVTLRVVSVLPAGTAATRALGPGEAARIMTGAPVPPGADAMVPFEDAERMGAGTDERCVVRRPASPGDHLRDAGADLARGSLALAAGTRLHARNLALLGALGVSTPLVGPRPRVAVLSTGDELLDLDAPLRPGAVRDSNGPMLAQLVEEAGGLVGTHTRVPDDPRQVERAVREAVGSHDVVVTLGGVSAGDHDPVRAALEAIGDVESWRVAMRPGRPQAFGTPGGRLFMGLPGNPASAVCVFEVLLRPALLALQGHTTLDRPRAPVICASAIPSRAGRTDLVRCTLVWRDGRLVATPAGAQVSGHLTPQANAHALLVVPEQADALAAGEDAEAIVWELP